MTFCDILFVERIKKRRFNLRFFLTRRVLNDNIDVPLKEGSFFVPSFVSLQGKGFNEREAENPGITRINGGADNES